MKRAYFLFLLLPICFFLMSLNDVPPPAKPQTINATKEAGIDLCMTWGNPNNIVTRFHVGPSIAAVLIAIAFGGEFAARMARSLRKSKKAGNPNETL